MKRAPTRSPTTTIRANSDGARTPPLPKPRMLLGALMPPLSRPRQSLGAQMPPLPRPRQALGAQMSPLPSLSNDGEAVWFGKGEHGRCEVPQGHPRGAKEEKTASWVSGGEAGAPVAARPAPIHGDQKSDAGVEDTAALHIVTVAFQDDVSVGCSSLKDVTLSTHLKP